MHSGANNTGGQGGHAHHERYQVFTFNFDGVESAYVVSLWIFIASIAKIGMYQVVAEQRIGMRVLVVSKLPPSNKLKSMILRCSDQFTHRSIRFHEFERFGLCGYS